MDTDVDELSVRLTLLRSVVPFGYVNVGGLIPTSFALAYVADGRVASGQMRWWVGAILLGGVLQLITLRLRPRFWDHAPFGWERAYGLIVAFIGVAWGGALSIDVVEGEPFTYQLLVVCFLLMTTAACLTAFAGSPLLGRRFLSGQWGTATVLAIGLGAYEIAVLSAMVWVLALIYLAFNTRLLRMSIVERERVTKLSRSLAIQASTDSLTGLKNRSATVAAIQQHLDVHHTVTVLFIDLNNFKRINDEYGHAAGDAVLVHVASRLSAVARSGDIVGRLGGDEFIVALTQPADHRHADKIAARFTAEIASSHGAADELAITAAIGTATSIHGATAEDLLSCADDAMYRAKAAGRSSSDDPELEPLD